MRKVILFVLWLLIAACSPTPTSGVPVPTPGPIMQPGELFWWNEIVFYEVFVRSFKDSNGDGIGDFNGITSKLDYLQELGVGGIWLMPIHPSPSYHGYDVTDYYAVNPEYGTLDDFKRLLDEAHKRDIRIIIDLVLNHTSSQHPFFEAAQSPTSPYRDWYIWTESPPDWGSWHETTSGFYYGLFCDCMPDLNYANPAVTEEMTNAANFWLTEVGVDGFRIDAAKHLFESDGKVENVPAMHDWFAAFYRDYKAVAPEAYTVGEVYGAGGFIASTYRGQMDHIFNFELASGFVNSAKGESNTGINSAYTFTLKDAPDGNYATFLTNHDQNRVMTVLNGNVEKAKVAATLLLTAPGTPFLYYGEEIGMTGAKPDELIRTPMQWNAEVNAGFTTGTPWEPVDPDYAQGVNVAAQADSPTSLLSHYRALIKLRNEHPALRTGATSIIATNNRAVFAVLRVADDDMIFVLINLSGESVRDYALDLASPVFSSSSMMEPLLGTANSLTITSQPLAELPPFSTFLFQIK